MISLGQARFELSIMRFLAVAYCSFDSAIVSIVPLEWTVSAVRIARRQPLAMIESAVAKAMAET